jgi:hypothetical protein
MPGPVPFLEQFAALRDPRQAAKVLYPLPELLLLLLCGTVAGADDFVELTLWGREHLAFLRRFLPFAHGIPSHDTLCEVIAAVDPALFKTCFTDWVERLRVPGPETIAIDGKTSRRSHARSKGRGPLHTVSAWATGQQLVLGQEAVSEKSNEIVAIPLLLRRLELQGALVTIDAMGTQTQIAQPSSTAAATTCWRSSRTGRARSARSKPCSPNHRPWSRPGGIRPSMASTAESPHGPIMSATTSHGCSPTAATRANRSFQA